MSDSLGGLQLYCPWLAKRVVESCVDSTVWQSEFCWLLDKLCAKMAESIGLVSGAEDVLGQEYIMLLARHHSPKIRVSSRNVMYYWENVDVDELFCCYFSSKSAKRAESDVLSVSLDVVSRFLTSKQSGSVKKTVILLYSAIFLLQ